MTVFQAGRYPEALLLLLVLRQRSFYFFDNDGIAHRFYKVLVGTQIVGPFLVFEA